jgi:surfeit locus 1 family protein
MRIRFHLRLIPFVVTVLLVAVGVSLAQWQTRRAEQKLHIEASLVARAALPPVAVGAALLDPAEVEYRQVRARGEFIRDWGIYLDNRPQNGRPGFYVVMPFRLTESGLSVLVERGWIPLNRSDRNRMKPFVTPRGTIDIRGIARLHAGRVMQLGAAPALKPAAIVQNLEIAAFSKAAGMPLQPIVIEQASVAGEVDDGLIRDWPTPSSGVAQHRGYAVQWYALALMALVFFIVTGCKREPV